MLAQAFEIKVALLGYVSVGKTTVLNALLQDKFSEVSMRRTTAGINYFRISTRSKQHDGSSGSNLDSSSNSESFYSDEQPMSADTIHKEIKTDNSRLREDNIICEKEFDIELDEPLFEMRDDSRLVLVDIPGINEAGISKKYIEYVEASWDSFDCVVVVMDAVQGVNTEEQVKLLKLVNEQCEKKKDIPVIVLNNKVDDPDDEDFSVLVDEARSEVEKIFGVQDLEGLLEKITPREGRCKRLPKSSPAFIPISAGNAFVYRTAAKLKLHEFKRLDKHYIDKIGHDEVGKFKWKRLSDEEKYEAVYTAVSDPTMYEERLRATNFDKFLSVLDYFIGGATNQKALIEKQLAVSLQNLSVQDDVVGQLSAIFDRSMVLDKPTVHLKEKFWSLFDVCQKEALQKFRKNPTCVALLTRPMEILVQYSESLHPKLFQAGRGGEAEKRREDYAKVVSMMKLLVEQQYGAILEKGSLWDGSKSNLSLHTIDNDSSNWLWVPAPVLLSPAPAFGVAPADTPAEGSSFVATPAAAPAGSFSFGATPTAAPTGGFSFGATTAGFGSGGSTAAAATPGVTKTDARNMPSHQYSPTGNVSSRAPTVDSWHNSVTGEVKWGSKDENPGTSLEAWEQLSLHDWETIIRSVLLMSHSRCFCSCFGKQILQLQSLLETVQSECCGIHASECKKSVKLSYLDGIMTPRDPEKYQLAVQLEVPSSFSDPSHWGHLASKVCQFMESNEN